MRSESGLTVYPKKHRLSAIQVIALGFALLILLGALLLMLPFASRSGQSIPFLNALFTSTSATCVTGLVVYDTWTQFTFFGQVVILLEIQLGGLGFMATALFALLMRKRIGLRERQILTEASSAMQIGGVVKLTRRVLTGTLLFEGIGALLLLTRFWPRFGFWQGLWNSIFHAISAFCNAGFDLMGILEPYSSLTEFVADPVVCLTVMALIAVGGIGFIVWDDVAKKGLHFHEYELHTKIMLVTTAILIGGGTILFLFTERNGVFAGMPWPERIMAAMFQAVTPRTAGFNTIDIASLSGGGTMLTILLMFVGAGPGSTGGGVKITTVAVAFLSVRACLRGRESVDISGRRLEERTVRRALCTVLYYAALAVLGAGLLVMCQNFNMRDALLEAFSAFGTVGLSTGITRELMAIPKLVLIALMYAGRIGSMTVILAFAPHNVGKTRNPLGKIMIG
jgi:trk system potassium uptake protein TrkH